MTFVCFCIEGFLRSHPAIVREMARWIRISSASILIRMLRIVVAQVLHPRVVADEERATDARVRVALREFTKCHILREVGAIYTRRPLAFAYAARGRQEGRLCGIRRWENPWPIPGTTKEGSRNRSRSNGRSWCTSAVVVNSGDNRRTDPAAETLRAFRPRPESA